jgi:hypothetical protein
MTNLPCPVTEDSVFVERDNQGKWYFAPKPPEAESDYEKESGKTVVGYISGTGTTVSVPTQIGTVIPSPNSRAYAAGPVCRLAEDTATSAPSTSSMPAGQVSKTLLCFRDYSEEIIPSPKRTLGRGGRGFIPETGWGIGTVEDLYLRIDIPGRRYKPTVHFPA